jgi:dienelactone hydrolase
MPIGHSVTGKAAEYIQRGAILLVKHGFVVLTYDPIGQGERRQLLDGGKAVLPASTNEHTMVGVGALLVGRSTASYRVWDGIRSLDYLASRPEVDPRVLGCTGCSGGGTMTSYLMALDDRIRAAAPSCYITSLERLFATIGPQDAEQNVPGQVAFGMEHADYLTMRAPRATLIAAATRDFFDIGGTWTSFREAKRLYGLMGHPERIDLMESDTTHGFPKPQREAVLRFLRRWLQGLDDAPTEPEFPIEKEQDLWCTRTGQVLEDLKGKSAFDLNAERLTELDRQRPAPRGPAELRKDVARLIGLRLPVPAAKMKEVGVVRREGYTIRKFVFETEPGVLVPGLLFDRGNGATLTLYVPGEGKAADLPALEKRAQAGERILAVDLRGFGETAPGKAGRPNLFGTDFHEAFVALHLDRPLLGRRVHDLLAVIGALKTGPVHLTGVGRAGPIALHAAVLDPERIAGLTLERSLVSWASVVRTPVSHDQLTNVVFGALAVYDLPDLEKQVSPRPLTVRDRVGPTGLVLSPGSR